MMKDLQFYSIDLFKVKLFVVVLVLSTFGLNAQVFFTEDFEGTLDPNFGLPSGWLETGNSTDGVWSVNTPVAASSAYLTFPPTTNGTKIAYTNDDICDCDKSVDRMYLPAQNFSGMVGVSLSVDVYNPALAGDSLSLEVSIDNGVTWTLVETFPTSANTWFDDYTVDLTQFAGNSNVLISFWYNDVGVWGYGAGIDDVVLTQLTSADDLGIVIVAGEYTRIPARQSSPINLAAAVSNNGVTNVVDGQLIANVYNNGSLIQSDTSFQNNINSGDTNIIAVGAFTPQAIGVYNVEYVISSAAITDNNPMNDTVLYSFEVTEKTYSRDNGVVAASIGVNGGEAEIVSRYDVNTAGTLDSVTTIHNSAVIGDTLFYFVYSMNVDTPGAIIGLGVYIITPADTNGLKATITVPITDLVGSPLSLTPGSYFIGVKEGISTVNYGLDVMEGIFIPNTIFANISGGPWTPLENLGFPNTPAIWGHFSNCAASYTSTMSTFDANCNGSADGLAISIGVGGTFSTYDYAWDAAAGNQTTGTATGLSAGTYIVSVSDGANCLITDTATITEPTAVLVLATNSGPNAATSIASGGTAPYTYMWDVNAGSQTTSTATGLAQGATYCVTATDANGCVDTACVAVPVIVGLYNFPILEELSIYPNPATEILNIVMEGQNSLENINVELTDLSGKTIRNLQLNNIGSGAHELNVSNLAAGTYFLVIRNEEHRLVRKIDVIR
jgi:hypothetical protein